MKLTIHNKLVILKKILYHYLLLNLYGLLLCIFFYILCFGYIYYILYIIYLYDQNWQLARSTNMSLSPFPLYQSSWNRLIAQRLPKAQKQTPTKQKRTTIDTLQDNIEK